MASEVEDDGIGATNLPQAMNEGLKNAIHAMLFEVGVKMDLDTKRFQPASYQRRIALRVGQIADLTVCGIAYNQC